jgi:hypothetical protein
MVRSSFSLLSLSIIRSLDTLKETKYAKLIGSESASKRPNGQHSRNVFRSVNISTEFRRLNLQFISNETLLSNFWKSGHHKMH